MLPSRRKEQIVEQKAQRILKFLKSEKRYNMDYLPPPYALEFTGSPSAGKTTTITELDKFLRRQGMRVLRPQEGAEVIRHVSRSTPLYNIRTGIYALQQLIDLSQGHMYDVVIFDRGIFHVYCWMRYWLEKSLLSKEECATIQSFFLSRFWMNQIDVAYFMVCDPEVAMGREMRIALSSKTGETTNPATIAKLIQRYRETYEI